MTRIGIYGGTFSPPHNGHVAAARAFMEQMWLDFLYVIPASLPPHKEIGNAVNAEQRLQMCRLAFEGIDGICVSDMEIARGGVSYTVDTLRALSGEDRRLFLLCGTDMVLTLDTWREAEEIFRLSYPTYVRREKDSALDARIIEKISKYHKEYGKVVRRIVTEPLEISSSTVRERIRLGMPYSALVPESVEKYIVDNHLYV